MIKSRFNNAFFLGFYPPLSPSAISLSRCGRVIFFLLLLFGLKLLLNHKLALLLSHLGLSSLVSLTESFFSGFIYFSRNGKFGRCFRYSYNCYIILDFLQLDVFLSRAFSRMILLRSLYRGLLILSFFLNLAFS